MTDQTKIDAKELDRMLEAFGQAWHDDMYVNTAMGSLPARVRARAAIHEAFNRSRESAAPSERTQSDLIDALAETVAQGSVLLKVQTDMHGDPSSYRIGVQYLGESDHREYVSHDFESALWNAVEDDGALSEEDKRLSLWGELDNPPTEEVEALVACLGDDAAQLRQDNSEDERAQTMDDAAEMLTRLELANRQLFEEGCIMYAKLTATPAAPAEPTPAQAGTWLTDDDRMKLHDAAEVFDDAADEQDQYGNNSTAEGYRARAYALRSIASPAPAPEAAGPSAQAITAQLRDLLDAQGQKGNWDMDQYMVGMYNGLALALSVADGQEPVYRSLEKAAGPQPSDDVLMRQALEAMEIKQRVTLWERDADSQKFRTAIAALRTRLASPPQTKENQQ